MTHSIKSILYMLKWNIINLLDRKYNKENRFIIPNFSIN